MKKQLRKINRCDFSLIVWGLARTLVLTEISGTLLSLLVQRQRSGTHEYMEASQHRPQEVALSEGCIC